MVGRLTPVVSVTPQGLPVAAQSGTLGASTGGGTPPPVTGARVRVSAAKTDAFTSCAALDDGANWPNQGGDWVDALGVYRGGTPFVTVNVVASPFVVDVSAITGDYWLAGVYNIQTASLDGVTPEVFWVHPSSNHSLALPSTERIPVMVINPGNGRQLTLSTTDIGSTLTVYQVQGPLINDMLVYSSATAYTTPNLLNLELTDQAAVITAAGGTGNIVGWSDPLQGPNKVSYEPQFQVETNGLHSLRFSDILTNGQHNNVRLLSWFLPITPITTGYMAFCVLIEGDVATGMNPASGGMKWPGPSNDDGTTSAYNTEIMSLRMEHAVPADVGHNPGVWGFHDYWYTQENGYTGTIHGGPAPFYPARYGTMMRTNTWYHVEMFFNLGTAGVANGTWTVWVNGVQIYTTSTFLFRNNAATKISCFHINFYQGGAGANIPLDVMHYRLAKIGVSSTRIGLPPELATPAWRRAATVKDTVYNLLGSENTSARLGTNDDANYHPAAAMTDHNGGFGVGANGTSWWSLANAGHNDWSNIVVKLDFTQDALRWVVKDGGSVFSAVNVDHPYYFDGRAAGAHSYYASQWAGPTIDGGNKMLRIHADIVYTNNGQWPYTVSGYNTLTNTWDPANTWSDNPYWCSPGTFVMTWHKTKQMFFCGQTNPSRWATFDPKVTQSFWYGDAANPGGDQTGRRGEWFYFWPGFSSGASAWGYVGSCMDYGRNRWVVVQQNGAAKRFEYMDVDALNLVTAVTLTGYAHLADCEFATSSLTHDEDNDRYLLLCAVNNTDFAGPVTNVLNRSTRVLAINPVTGVTTDVGQMPDCPGTTVGGREQNQGATNRFFWSSVYHGCFYAGDAGQPVHFMPTVNG